MSAQRESQSNRGRLIRLSISAAANGLSRNRLATIAATTTMTLMLMVLASVLVIRAGLDAALSYADSKVEVIAYLKSSVTESEARGIQVQIEGIEGVKGATYVSADDALAAFKVRLKERELTTEFVNWDDKLTLEFNGPRPVVRAIEITSLTEAVTVYLLGDSTVCDQPKEPWNSWGQMLPRLRRSSRRASSNSRQISSCWIARCVTPDSTRST